jgi:signal transduction histidine kinase
VLYDLGLALSPRDVPADVVIVAIDEASIAAIGRWPWRRAVHTTLLERLAVARPRAVMLDLVLSEPDPDPRQDALLAQALRDAAPVLVPVAWYALPGESPRLLEPVGPLRDAARPVQAEVEPDRDGLLRHTFLRAGLGSARLPHAALALLEAGGESLPPALAVERRTTPASTTPGWVRDERLPIRFQGPAGHLKRVSYVDVLTGAVPPAALAGRYVLVGMTAAGLGDAHATPVAAPMQGIEVIGQILQSLRRGDTLRSPDSWATVLGSALAVLLLLTAFGRMNPRYALALSFGLAIASLVGSVVLVGLGWWITPAGFAAGALLAYPLWSWRRLEVTAAALDQEIARLHADTPHGAVPERELADDRRLTAFSEAAARLRSARRFLAASLDGLPEAVLLADAHGRVTLANRRAAALFEVGDASELAGLSLAELLGELTRADAVDWPARLRSVAEQGGVLAVQSQLADHGDLLVSVARAPDADGPRLIATCADISEIKTAERAREEALAFVSHDLRSPLASIALMADFHRAGVQPLPLDQMVAEMQRLARRGLELSESFVRAAQAQAKPLELEPGDLAELLAEVVRDLAPQAVARAMKFTFDPSPLGAAASHFDRELLGRALGNLIGNAIKYAPQGSTITLGLQAREGGHLFWVQDEGPGLEAEQVARLFRAYSRVGASASQAGVGLGLQFVQRVAERHGGWVQAYSTPGQGARFELFVPSSRS